MSNQNRPTLGLPGGAPPPPPAPPAPPPAKAIPAEVAAILDNFPRPWCVGPYGDIWVAADVEMVGDDVTGQGVVDDGKNRWRPTGVKARMVMENPAGEGVAALIVYAVNKLV